MVARRVLITGANGYIASRLIPRLLGRGYRLCLLAREPGRLVGRRWLSQVEVQQGSTSNTKSLDAALAGVHTAYYLIHSMSSGRGYTEIERQSAQRFAAAAEAAGVEHIIYLGGLANPADPHLAAHMRSRIETGEILRRGPVPVTEFRAGVITGAGSISFEMIRFLTEYFPILPGPRWLRNLAQPIASENVIDYLVAAIERPDARGGIYEMGGPEQMQYGDAMLRYAEVRGLKRRLFTLPGIPIWWMAILVDRLTPVPYPIATALIGGLQSDSIVMDDLARRVFPEIKLIGYEEAVHAALGDLAPERLERVWEGIDRDAANFRHEGFIVDHRRRAVEAPASKVYERLLRIGGRNGWPYGDWLWRLRGLVDKRTVAPAPQNNPMPDAGAISRIGDLVDYYRVEELESGRLLRLRSDLRAPGEAWLEWRVEADSLNTSFLTQTAFFAPRGAAGLLYWLALAPFHQVVLHGLIDAIKRQSESA